MVFCDNKGRPIVTSIDTLNIGMYKSINPNARGNKINEAIKFDDNKPQMGLLPPKALQGIADIFTYGAKKYASHNYKSKGGLDWNRVYDAALRHLNAWNDGENKDPETKKSHLYHAGCCIMMLIDLVESGIGKDTRFKKC